MGRLVQVKTTDQGACPREPDQKRSITVTNDCLVQQWLLVGTLEKLPDDSDIAQFLLALYFSANKNGGENPKLTVRCSSCESSLMPMWRCLHCQRQFAFAPCDNPVSKMDPAKLAQPMQAKQIDGFTALAPVLDSKVTHSKLVDSSLIRAGLYQTIASWNIASKNSSKQAQIESDTHGSNQKSAGVNSANCVAMPSTDVKKNTETFRVVLKQNVRSSPNFLSPPIVLPQSERADQSNLLNSEQVKNMCNTLSVTPYEKTAGIHLAKNVATPITVGQNKTRFVRLVVVLPTNVKLPPNFILPQNTKGLPIDGVSKSLPTSILHNLLVPLNEASSLPPTGETGTGKLNAELNEQKTPTVGIQYDNEPKHSLMVQQRHHREAYKRKMEDLMLLRERLRKKRIEEEKKIRKAQPKRHQCNFCQKIVCSNYYLQEHIAAKHTTPRHVCELCNKVFISRNALNVHLRKHTGQRPFLCEICAKGFFNSSALKKHIGIHLGQKPHVCKECGKGFLDANKLASHMLTHTQVKKFVCDICGRAFAWAANMRSHRQRHENANYRPLTVTLKSVPVDPNVMPENEKL